MSKLRAPGLLILLLLAMMPLRAEVVRDLYAAEVPVAGRQQAALDAASRDAMAQVLVKLSGSQDVLSFPEVKSSLSKSRGYVQQYAYRGGQGDTPLTARFEFDGNVMTRIVTDAGAPLWTANRPPVLAWVVLEDETGRRFLGRETDPELAAQLERAFSDRGVPLRLPLLDLADAAALTVDQAWRQDGALLAAASGRYGVADILAGRFARLSTGGWLGDWSYFSDRRQVNRTLSNASGEEALAAAAALVAEDMAERYAVLPTSSAAAGGVRMQVVGVRDYGDYAGVVAWLESLELITHANVEHIAEDRIELRLVAQADAEQLASIIELNDRLVPAPVAQTPGVLFYQWRD